MSDFYPHFILPPPLPMPGQMPTVMPDVAKGNVWERTFILLSWMKKHPPSLSMILPQAREMPGKPLGLQHMTGAQSTSGEEQDREGRQEREGKDRGGRRRRCKEGDSGRAHRRHGRSKTELPVSPQPPNSLLPLLTSLFLLELLSFSIVRG